MLLTRSPLGHPPEGGASLDLHVLSTPPAFVLSQDQTLREGIWTADANVGLSTQKVTVLRRFQSLVHTSCCARLYQRNSLHGRLTPTVDESLYGTNFRHAVEFSRSGRTPSRPFQVDRGQPETHYPVGSARSNTTGTARIPLGRGDSAERRASCLGDVRPASPSIRTCDQADLSGSVPRTSQA